MTIKRKGGFIKNGGGNDDHVKGGLILKVL